MRLALSDMSPLPLREQIVRRIRELVLSGELPEHTQLPSIRALAQVQRVGIVTVQRAYEDLEREKTIYARQGKGFFVAPLKKETRRLQAVERARQELRRPVAEARMMGMSNQQIHDLIKDILSELEEKR